jgi:hypothetical protein
LEQPRNTMTDKVRQIHRIVLGANIGFLPFLTFYLVFEFKLDLSTYVVLWVLTTWIIINEWWSLDTDLEMHPSESRIILILNFI